ncbi:MAG: phosphoribosylformylglycinamidine synthase I [Proteobacteria bacterium]|nr:phosphoribosylformylglycinamidine synthase I [Pseudomonadota bacterium]
MNDVKVLVLTGYGLNCDHETAYAFELAGAVATRVHINSLIDGSQTLSDYHILVFGGGFSWGDDHGAGVVQAVRLKTHIGSTLKDFINKGNLILGICNGFQTLVNMGLLPGFDGDYQTRRVALTYNDCGNFRDDWVTLKVNSKCPCVFTKGMDILEYPIRHGEGKFYAEPKEIETLVSNNQVAIRYAMADGTRAMGKFPENPNGSVDDIAGICDSTGRVFGLMPHPEAFNHPTNHPTWTRTCDQARRMGEDATTRAQDTLGIRLFRNGVDYIRNRGL